MTTDNRQTTTFGLLSCYPQLMTRVIKWCWCSRWTSPSWRTTTTMSSTTQHTHSDRCWYHHQGYLPPSILCSCLNTSTRPLWPSRMCPVWRMVLSTSCTWQQGGPQNPSAYRVIITFIPILVSTPTLQSSFSTTSWMSRYGRNSKEIGLNLPTYIMF